MKQTHTHPKYFLLLILCLAVTACEKNNELPPSVSIDILSPHHNQVFDEGDTVRMHAKLSTTGSLHDFRIQVVGAENGDIWYDYLGHAHTSEIELNQYFIPAVARDENLVLQVTSLDHKGDIVQKSVPFVVRNSIAEIPPTILLSSPTASSHLHAGDLLTIAGEVVHDTFLRSVTIELSIDGEQLLYETLEPANQKRISFSHDVYLPVNRFGFYRVRVVATDLIGATNTTILHLSIHK